LKTRDKMPGDAEGDKGPFGKLIGKPFNTLSKSKPKECELGIGTNRHGEKQIVPDSLEDQKAKKKGRRSRLVNLFRSLKVTEEIFNASKNKERRLTSYRKTAAFSRKDSASLAEGARTEERRATQGENQTFW